MTAGWTASWKNSHASIVPPVLQGLHTSGHSRVMRDATPRTSDRERRNWARRFDWLELRCQDRVRVRRTASELESSPIVIESQLSSSRSKSPELTRRRRLWLSESDIALGLFRVHVVPRGAASPAETCAARGSFPPVERSAGCARQWWVEPRKRDHSKDAHGLPLSAGSLERRNEIRHIFRSDHDFG